MASLDLNRVHDAVRLWVDESDEVRFHDGSAAAAPLPEREDRDGDRGCQHADQRRAEVHPPPPASELDVDGLQRVELAREALDHELREALRPLDVLQTSLAEVADRNPRRELVLDELARRRREQHLPAVARGPDARGLVDAHADVALLTHSGLAGVQAHAHLDLYAFGPSVRMEVALRRHCGPDRVFPAWEGDEERVALRVDLVAPVSRRGLADDALVLGEHFCVVRADLPEQLRRPFDVGEEEGDRSARKLRHRRSLTQSVRV